MPSLSNTLSPDGEVYVADSSEQYLRKVELFVSDSDGAGLDLSLLRIKFSVKRSDSMTPNMADIRVYNVKPETAQLIKKEFKQVILQAGYESNYGVIFQGNIKQVIIGRESGTDTFIDIIAGDGDRAYNFSIVNTTIAAGCTQSDQLKSCVQSMSAKGVTEGHVGEMPTNQLPRGKVMYGNARNYLRNVAQTTDKSWSIQDEKITFVSNTSYLPGEAVELTSKTGMIGAPSQTNEGVNVKCLLNPRINTGGRIKIDNASVEQLKINFQVPGSPSNYPAPLDADGFYYVLVVEHQGDTRGVEWYSTLVCLIIHPTSNPINSVPVGYGG